MRLLLDTHIVIWLLEDPSRLSGEARELIGNPANELVVSDISLWEIAIKHVNHPDQLGCSASEYARRLQGAGITRLMLERDAIDAFEALDLAQAEGRHKDPFDRMLIAQAKVASMMLVTHDKLMSLYGEPMVRVV